MMKKLLMTVTFALASFAGLYAQGVTSASISGMVTDKKWRAIAWR